MQHMPVMCAEVVKFLAIDPNGVYIDATFGRGGHSRAILECLRPEGRLLAIDKDPEALDSATVAFGQDPCFEFELGSFANLPRFIQGRGWAGRVSGIVFDLGVSSPQLEDAKRGFSFMQDGPLDMRMDPTSGISAASWLGFAKEKDIADVLWQYGEERFSRRIARTIVEARKMAPLTRTFELAELILRMVPRRRFDRHPATQSFQAIRIFVNQELEDLKKGLVSAIEALKVGGRLVVISFHSLEDRIVKRFMQEAAGKVETDVRMPVMVAPVPARVNVVLAKGRPSKEEVARNPRARSAIMRVVEKVTV